MRIGPRFDVTCTHVTTAQGHKLPCVDEIRYLGTFIVAGRQVRCSITHAKRSFHRALNAIFGKIGRLASEEVILELVKRKVCLFYLFYGLECCPLLKEDIRSLGFVVTRFLMKLFKSMNTDTINDCRIYFNFLIYYSELVEIRMNRFESKFIDCCNVLYYFGINKIT